MKHFFPAVINAIATTFNEFRILTKISLRRIQFKVMISDFFSVAASIGFVAITSLVFGICVLVIPQGRDAFLLVVEKMIEGDFRQFIGLVLSICFWSYAAELAVRYAIAVSDNSGLNLSEHRVRWRKAVQKILAAFFLVFPFLVVFIELIRLMFVATFIPQWERGIFLGGSVISLGVVFSLVIYLYFHKFGTYGPNKPQKTVLGKRSLPPQEQSWLNKLYGIYSDFTFTFPKASAFERSYKYEYQAFLDKLIAESGQELNGLPQNDQVLSKGRLVPEAFQLINSGHVDTTGYVYKWVYHVPKDFYRCFHRQVKRLFYVSLLILICIALMSADSVLFRVFGAPGLICLAFGCYTGIYAGLLFIDRTVFATTRMFSLRAALVILFIITSYFNLDHPVREIEKPEIRQSVRANFDAWFTNYKSSFVRNGQQVKGKYPVIFICAEGGAFRTGAYTAVFLSRLGEILARDKDKIDFVKSIYGMSGVSGGAVGLGYYNAVNFQDTARQKLASVEKAKEFFMHDSLSPLIGKMLFGEFLQLFIPIHIERFDRAIALEKTWEYAYGSTFPGRENIFKKPFIDKDAGVDVRPTLIINTTEVESGLQCWLVNHSAVGLRFAEQRELFSGRLGNLRYSTAVNFSSRFPLFSPAATIRECDRKSHFVDGGYVENTGSASMLELLEMIRKDKVLSAQIAPVVITLLFAADDQAEHSNINWFNELSEVALAAYNVRGGNTRTSRAELKFLVDSVMKGVSIDAPFRSKSVPMNWVLSGRSMKEVDTNVQKILHPKENVMKSIMGRGYTYLRLPSKSK